MKPYQQIIENGKILRTFLPDVEDEELKWHQDLKDRKVKIIEGGNWQFQIDNSMPNKLLNGQELWIPKFVWHRVLKGDSPLVVEIEESE
jgi:hypothetical protein